jgi:hypothetical protein
MTTAKTEQAPIPLITRLVEVAQEIDHIDKGGYNKAQEYHFVKATDVARAIREGLYKRGILTVVDSTVESVLPYTSGKGGQMFLTTVRGTITFIDTLTDATLVARGVGQGTDSGDKGVFKAITGMIKYMLTSTFLIPNEGDDPEVDRADEREDRPTTVATRSPKPTPVIVDSGPFIAKAKSLGLEGPSLKAFVGIVTGGKSKSEITPEDLAALDAKLMDTELLDELLSAKY